MSAPRLARPERPASPAADHLRQVGWAVLMIDLILLLLALLFVPHFGGTLTLLVFGTLAAGATLVVGGLAVLNVLTVRLYERWEKRAARRRDARPPDSR